jgi:hypothetical protein
MTRTYLTLCDGLGASCELCPYMVWVRLSWRSAPRAVQAGFFFEATIRQWQACGCRALDAERPQEFPNRAKLIMAHEFAHIVLGVSPSLLTNYVQKRGWLNRASPGSWGSPNWEVQQWVDSKGRTSIYSNPAEHLAHVVALFVSGGNSFSHVTEGLGPTGMWTGADRAHLREMHAYFLLLSYAIIH